MIPSNTSHSKPSHPSSSSGSLVYQAWNMIKTPMARTKSTPFEEQELISIKDSKQSRYGVKSIHLPPNFHEAVLEMEMQIETGTFNIKTIE